MLTSRYEWFVSDTDKDNCIQCPNCNHFLEVYHECGVLDNYDCLEIISKYKES